MLIFINIIVGALLIVTFSTIINNFPRKNKIEHWQKGDKLMVRADRDYAKILKENGVEFAILRGWTLTHVYVNLGDDTTYQIVHKDIYVNKSALWRKNFNDAKSIMGTDPDFSNKVPQGILENKANKKSKIGKEIDGKPVELLTETECNVYLSQALKDEDFLIAAEIRKRLESFR